MGLRVASSCSTSRAGKSGLKKQKLPFSRLAGAAGLKCGDQRDAHLFDDRGGAVVGELGFGGGEVGGERLVVEDARDPAGEVVAGAVVAQHTPGFVPKTGLRGEAPPGLLHRRQRRLRFRERPGAQTRPRILRPRRSSTCCWPSPRSGA
jgi:hypothetical protein